MSWADPRRCAGTRGRRLLEPSPASPKWSASLSKTLKTRALFSRAARQAGTKGGASVFNPKLMERRVSGRPRAVALARKGRLLSPHGLGGKRKRQQRGSLGLRKDHGLRWPGGPFGSRRAFSLLIYLQGNVTRGKVLGQRLVSPHRRLTSPHPG